MPKAGGSTVSRTRLLRSLIREARSSHDISGPIVLAVAEKVIPRGFDNREVSLGEEELLELAVIAETHGAPLVDDIIEILDWRAWSKRMSLYRESWPQVVGDQFGLIQARLDHPLGWGKVVQALFGRIQASLSISPVRDSATPIILSTGERFGRLSVIHGCPERELALEQLIAEAAAESMTICWDCGDPGMMVVIDEIIAPRCPACAKNEATASEQ